MTKTKAITYLNISGFLNPNINKENLISKMTTKLSINSFLRQLRFETCINIPQYKQLKNLLFSDNKENFKLGQVLINNKVKEFYNLGYDSKGNLKVIKK